MWFQKSREPADSAALRATLQKTLKPAFEGILDDFYNDVGNKPGLAPILQKGPGVAKLKSAQIAHWEALLQHGRSEIVRQRGERIGQAHVRVGLTPDHYVESYNFFFKAMIFCLLKRDPGSAELLAELVDILFYDMNIALSAFHTGTQDDAKRREALEMAGGVETQIRSSKSGLDAKGAELLAMTQDLDGAVHAVTRGVEMVQNGIGSTSANVNSVAAAIYELNASSEEVGRQAHAASQLVREAARAADNAAEKMDRLSDLSNQISEVVRMIAAISSQTNLLALNATIEAARAGEAGRGFAIVATEVKQLSQRTNQATQSISERVQEIVLASQATVQALSEARGKIVGIDEIASSVAVSSESQIEALRSVSNSATSAAKGGESLAASVRLFTDAVSNAERVASGVAVLTKSVNLLFDDMATQVVAKVRSYSDYNRREHPRIPTSLPIAVHFDGRSEHSEMIDLSMGGAKIRNAPEGLTQGRFTELRITDALCVRAVVEERNEQTMRVRFVENDPAKTQELSAMIGRLQPPKARSAHG